MRTIWLLLAFICSTAYPAATIFSSSTEVKALKDNFSINAKAKWLTGTDDPRSVAKNAPMGSLYSETDTGNVYRKQDNGSSVNWALLSDSGSAANPDVTTQTATYTAVNTDDTILLVASNGPFTVNLFTTTGNSGKVLELVKLDTSFNAVTLDPNGSEVIASVGTFKLASYGDRVRIQAEGSSWRVLSHSWDTAWNSFSTTFNGFGTTSNQEMFWKREGPNIHIRGYVTAGTATITDSSFDLPTGLSIDTTKTPASGRAKLGDGHRLDSGSASPINHIEYFYDSASATKVHMTDRSASNVYTRLGADSVPASGNSISVDVIVPISGWEG